MPESLSHLRHQTYPNYDIFILDDSSDAGQRALVDRFGYTVIRRATRRGFKAGNLNNWLDIYGLKYKYFVILDNDSLISEDFVARMVEYAEHPDNRQIAEFQSKILTWNMTTPIQRALGALAPFNMYVLERFTNRTGTMLSFGHNNLIRTECVLQVGGFNEYVTAEDTALSLTLSAIGYAVKLVDVVSYDTEPSDVFRYARRTIRWAGQTVELFRLPWRSAAFRLKMILCHQLYHYLVFNLYFGLLFLIAWTPTKGDYRPLSSLIAFVVNNRLYFAPWFVALLVMTGLWVLQIALRFVIARRAGVPVRDFLLYILISTSLMYFIVFPLGAAMARTARGARTTFTPTNTRSLDALSLRSITKYMLPSLIYGTLLFVGMALRNRYLFFSFNCIWLLLLPAAPLVLWLFHAEKRPPKEDNRWTMNAG